MTWWRFACKSSVDGMGARGIWPFIGLLAFACAKPQQPPPDASASPPPPLLSVTSTLDPPDAMIPSDPPPPDAGVRAHCIVFTLKNPTPARIKDFVRRAAADGIVVNEDSGLQVAFMTDEKIVSVFGGKVVYQRMPPSATSSGRRASLTVANLEHTTIPARYAGDLASVTIGHQICE